MKSQFVQLCDYDFNDVIKLMTSFQCRPPSNPSSPDESLVEDLEEEFENNGQQQFEDSDKSE